MTDLEITQRCAEAMGWRPAGTRKDFDKVKAIPVEQFPGALHYQYAPLRDDGACLEFVRRFDMIIEPDDLASSGTVQNRSWGVTIFVIRDKRRGRDMFIVRNCPDLRRAICECVARMMVAASTSNPKP